MTGEKNSEITNRTDWKTDIKSSCLINNLAMEKHKEIHQ